MRAGSLRAHHNSARREARSLPWASPPRKEKSRPAPKTPPAWLPAPAGGVEGALPKGDREQRLLPALLWMGDLPVGTARLTPFILLRHIKKRIGKGEKGSFHCWEAVGEGGGRIAPNSGERA